MHMKTACLLAAVAAFAAVSHAGRTFDISEENVCGIRFDSHSKSGKIYCWGNEDPALGLNDDNNEYNAPTLVLGPDNERAVFTDIWGVKNDNNGFCAQTLGGDLLCWGDARGDSFTDNDRPYMFPSRLINFDTNDAPLEGSRWVELGLGQYYSCGIRDTGALYCWDDEDGNDWIGDGTSDSYPLAVKIGKSNWVYVVSGSSTASSSNTLAIDTDGALYVWGSEDSSGTGATGGTITTPTKIEIDGVWLKVATDQVNQAWCGIMADKIYCVGDGSSNFGFNSGDTPVEVDLSEVNLPTGRFVDIVMGENYGCVLHEANNGNRDMYCFGDNNDYGQWGIGSTNEPSGPLILANKALTQHMSDFKNYVSISASYISVCALIETHAGGNDIYCVGEANHFLGTGLFFLEDKQEFYDVDADAVVAFAYPVTTSDEAQNSIYGVSWLPIEGDEECENVTEPTVSSTIWTLFTAFGIFLYQLSSVLLISAKTAEDSNYASIQFTNLTVGILAWYLVGYAFSYGISLDSKQANKFIGNYGFAMHRIRECNHNTTSYGYAWFIQSFFYAMVCNAIVSEGMGTTASRTAHVISTVFVISFVYPVIAHWVWSTNGWLSAIRPETVTPLATIGAIDFAGSGVVHLLGASISLAASLLLRTKGASVATKTDSAADKNTYSLGGFLRVFAALSFVTGSSISIAPRDPTESKWFSAIITKGNADIGTAEIFDANDNLQQAVGRAAVCLTLAISAASAVVMIVESLLTKEVALRHQVNAMTIGFAAISSNILTCEPWAAILCGLMAGLIYVGGRRGLKNLQDNDVFTIHGLGGIWGLLFTGILAKPKFIRDVVGNFYPGRLAVSAVMGDDFTGQVLGVSSWSRHSGVFYPTGKDGKSGHSNGKLLACMILEAVIIFAWGFAISMPLFFVLKAVKKLKAGGAAYTTGKTDA